MGEAGPLPQDLPPLATMDAAAVIPTAVKNIVGDTQGVISFLANRNTYTLGVLAGLCEENSPLNGSEGELASFIRSIKPTLPRFQASSRLIVFDRNLENADSPSTWAAPWATMLLAAAEKVKTRDDLNALLNSYSKTAGLANSEATTVAADSGASSAVSVSSARGSLCWDG